jgi:hypothetical protein
VIVELIDQLVLQLLNKEYALEFLTQDDVAAVPRCGQDRDVRARGLRSAHLILGGRPDQVSQHPGIFYFRTSPAPAAAMKGAAPLMARTATAASPEASLRMSRTC